MLVELNFWRSSLVLQILPDRELVGIPVHKVSTNYSSLSDLAWANIEQTAIDNLINSMRNRIFDVVYNKCDVTKY